MGWSAASRPRGYKRRTEGRPTELPTIGIDLDTGPSHAQKIDAPFRTRIRDSKKAV